MRMISALLLAVFGWFIDSFKCETIDGSVQQTCTASSTNCTILCEGERACRYNSFSCPTNLNCQYCELYCEGAESCIESTIYGNNCLFLNITLGPNGHDAGRQMTIYAPGNNGSLLADMAETDQSGGLDDSFKDTIIYDSREYGGTNEIILNCRSSANDECQHTKIYGYNSNYVEVNCFENVYCNQMEIYCPLNSSLKTMDNNNNNNDIVPCKLTCESTVVCDASIYVAGRAWEDDLEFFS